MRSALLLLLLVACGSSSGVHEVVRCESGSSGDCEYGCRNGQPATDAGSCIYVDPRNNTEHICPSTFFTDGAYPGHHGCCMGIDGVVTFLECCTPDQTGDRCAQ